MKCFKGGEQGHISKFCRKQKIQKKFVSQSRKFSQNNQSGSQSLVEEPKTVYKEYFSFFQTTSNNPFFELVLDSGALSHLIKDECLFIEIDKGCTGTITNANSRKKSIEGRGTNEKRTEDSKGCERKTRLSNSLLVIDNLKNLVSVSKIRAADNEILFGKDLEIRTKNVQFSRLKNMTIFCFENREFNRHRKP